MRNKEARTGSSRSRRWSSTLVVLGLIAASSACASAADDGQDGGDPDTADETVEGAAASDGDGACPEMELSFASFFSPRSADGVAITAWMAAVEEATGGALTFETFWDASLVAAPDTIQAVRDGRVQLGHSTSAYTPTDFPLTTVAHLPFMGTSIGVQTEALNALYESNEALRSEYEDQNLQLVSLYGTPGPLTGSPEEITDLDWFEGKTIRTTGGTMSAIVEAAGADTAGIPAPEVYEAVERGTVDAYSAMILDVLVTLSLHEVGPNIVDAGIGHYGDNIFVMNREQWESFPAPCQEVLEGVTAGFTDLVTDAKAEAEDAACVEILDAGGSVSIFPESETEELQDRLGSSLQEAFVERADAAGADGQALLDEYVEHYEQAASGPFADQQSGMERCVDTQDERS